MESDAIWGHIDEQRLSLADLIESLGADQLATPSLCSGWTVRDVAVHLTHSHTRAGRVLFEAAKSGFRFDAMVRRLAIEDRADAHTVAIRLRSMVGSRRHPIGTTELEPLLDTLVHGQDIAVPLGIDRHMPADAAAAAAHRVWAMRFPFHPRRDHRGIRFVATDSALDLGHGQVVEAPTRDILMLFAGRTGAAGELLDLSR
ncbi:maleylpyruvate isomerase family mycothiol-dependent enzyme [Gordonia sp. SID5947]|uniref:maleylpyruvate isomerase family mycothiol-dependent enzyme n=1 Tax=Gordonia sp. SID5947 TaxID=2690315 RepID=UPI00136CBA7F|nr:maleylpyruvate isomerase family mycothiol-dependent enzyme [Gordonia sp. SID5947]MYR04999.1 maleylpyruvate isomerase family mycothiol-dependent enzyme [Gordonia sp. SID5947]